MTGLVRRATLFSAVGLLAASAAMAGVPSASTSTQPGTKAIRIVGHGSPPDAVGNYSYTVRDAANNAVPGSTVIINFAGCGSIRICSSDFAVGAGVNCAAKTVSMVTNASGQVTFAVAGAGNGVGASNVFRCATVTADGVPFDNIGAASGDNNGVGGVEVVDLGGFAANFFAFPGTYASRSDFDGDNDIDVVDLGGFAAVFFSGGSPASCGTLCP